MDRIRFRRLTSLIRDFRTWLWLAVFVVGGISALVSGKAHAQAVPVTVSPYAVTPTVATSTGLAGTVSYQATAGQTAANSRFYLRSVEFSKATLGAAARTRRLLGPSLALTLAIEAAGWAINEVTGQVTQSGNDPGGYTQLPNGATGWDVAGGGCLRSSLSASITCVFPGGNHSGPSYAGYVQPNTSGWGSYSGGIIGVRGVDYQGTHQGGIYWFMPIGGTGLPQVCTVDCSTAAQLLPTVGDPWMPAVTSAVTDDAIGQVVLSNPATWPEVLNNPIGTPRVLTPMPSQMAAVQAQYRADTGIPLTSGQTEPSPVPSAQEAVATATEPVPAGSTVAPPAAAATASLSLPAFCTWASSICAAASFLSDPGTASSQDAMTLPEVAVPATAATWSTGLGAGSCPPGIDVSVDFMGTIAPIQFSYDPLCQFAVILNPLMNLIALVFAALIVAGVRMGRN